jgi:diguanylate cyclase (GGDEF)-like protein
MRRFGLLGKFAVASAAAMLMLWIVLARVEAAQIRARALASATDSGAMLAEVGLQSHLVPSDITDGLNPAKLRELDEVFQSGVASGRIARVKIWSPEGRIIYSDDQSLIGRTFPIASDLHEALDGETESDVSSLDKAENVGERSFGQLLEVYVPLRFTASSPAAGAFELYLPYQPIAQASASDERRLYLIIMGGLALLWGALFRMVLGASRRLRRDADELRQHADANEYLALHDQLTDLPNRTLFHDRVEQAIVAAGRDGSRTAIMILDLDRFKEINDTLGHDHGDVLLAQIGPRIRGVLRGVDTVARLGGDEFGILLGGLHSREEAMEVGDKITASLVNPFELSDTDLEIGASIGIALYPDHGDDADSLMRRAEVAMYVAKAARVPLDVYSVEHDHYTKDRLTLITELRRAIDAGEIGLEYQPKLDIARRLVVGAEALARWQHPQRGFVPPDVFVPLAEHAGLIRRLTSHVLDLAMAQCRAWRDAGVDLTVAVNISVRDLLDPRLPDQVAELLHRHALDPGCLGLELTESSVMDQPARAVEVLDRLASMGVTLAIDDFGTGYSSLAYLQRLPVRELKIDRSFVMGLRANENDAAIVHSTIDLGHNLGLIVVAEGVEDEESLERLATMGCNIAQGYHVARPMPPDQIEGWLRASGLSVGTRVATP